METSDKINELHIRKEKLELCGGADRVKKQHDAGKMTARERLEKLSAYIDKGQGYNCMDKPELEQLYGHTSKIVRYSRRQQNLAG